MLGPLSRGVRVAVRSFRPKQLRLIVRDLLPRCRPQQSDVKHVEEAIDWLCRAHDAAGRRGVAAGYYPSHGGWLDPYPETTGYIIPTFLHAASTLERPDLVDRALAMGEWEIEEQLPDGAVRGGVGLSGPPIVFNTGQVMLGWLALHSVTAEARFLEAAHRAGAWLRDVQDSDGAWRRHTHEGLPHAYHTRVAWPILATADATGDSNLRRAGQRHLEWVLEQAEEDGWIRHMGFTEKVPPLTHTIAYTLRGAVESLPFLPEEVATPVLDLAARASEALVALVHEGQGRRVVLAGQLRRPWLPAARYGCVTGNAQLALAFIRLGSFRAIAGLESAAGILIDDVCARQIPEGEVPEMRGAVPGSFPCWGAYNPLSFPNWATKFFADALLVRMDLGSLVEASAPAVVRG